MRVHASGPSVKPIWTAVTRSNADPCTDSGSFGSESRIDTVAARTEFSPSEVLMVKCSASPSATWRMNAPAKQSACCSNTMPGSSSLTIPLCCWIAWPYSCASTITTDIGPNDSIITGSRLPRSQPMVLSSEQYPALVSP